jgi:D-serine deaminase-like pyridoxal phosphate-dependent protein
VVEALPAIAHRTAPVNGADDLHVTTNPPSRIEATRGLWTSATVFAGWVVGVAVGVAVLVAVLVAVGDGVRVGVEVDVGVAVAVRVAVGEGIAPGCAA